MGTGVSALVLALAIGSTACSGATGPQGADGAPGTQGAQGTQGAKGDTGAPGEQGDTGGQGPKGDPGAPGHDGTIHASSCSDGQVVIGIDAMGNAICGVPKPPIGVPDDARPFVVTCKDPSPAPRVKTTVDLLLAAAHETDCDRAAVVLATMTSLSLIGAEDLAPVAPFTQLESLSLTCDQGLKDGAHDVVTYGPLKSLTKLRTLTVYGCSADVAPLGGLTQLERLSVGQKALEDLQDLKGLKALKELSIEYAGVRHLDGIEAMTKLESLQLSHCSGGAQYPGEDVDDLSPLAGLTELKSVDLACQGSLVDVRALGSLPKLVDVSLMWTQVRVVDAFNGNATVQRLDLRGSPFGATHTKTDCPLAHKDACVF